MLALWGLGFVFGLAVAVFASRQGVSAALAASDRSNISPGLIGLTVLAIGTDLPEITNSIVAALGGHGDIGVGDAVGSAFTQVTLVLGLLCLAGRPISADRSTVLMTGGMATAALFVVALMVSNGVISRWEGLALVLAWIAAIGVIHRRQTVPEVRTSARLAGGAGWHALAAIAWLALVGAAATLVIESFVRITDRIGIPELVASALVLSLGTSLPELIVDWTAIRRGAVALAIGDLFGSTLLDSTLAVGIGPALRAVDVSSAAVATCLIAALAVVAATTITASKPVHGRGTAPLLLMVYVSAVAAVLISNG
jgi:cation:H+ antiporter